MVLGNFQGLACKAPNRRSKARAAREEDKAECPRRSSMEVQG
jgi:hypothetical protein